MQSGLPLCSTALVVKKFIPTSENAVGNQLLEGRILFHLRTRPIAGMFRVEKHTEITIDVFAEALKVANFMKDRRGNHKHMFNTHSFLHFEGISHLPAVLAKLAAPRDFGKLELTSKGVSHGRIFEGTTRIRH
jgi:hypothetical protein